MKATRVMRMGDEHYKDWTYDFVSGIYLYVCMVRTRGYVMCG